MHVPFGTSPGTVVDGKDTVLVQCIIGGLRSSLQAQLSHCDHDPRSFEAVLCRVYSLTQEGMYT